MPCSARSRRRASTSASGSRAGRSSRSTTRSRAARPCGTSWHVTSRAPATWPRATRARPAGSGWRWRPPGPGATNLVTPIADAWMDSTPLVCVTGQVRSHLIGTDAFQECDITGITIPIVKHSWLVQDAQEIPHDHEGGLPRRANRALRPRARRRPARHPGGRGRLQVPGRGRSARLEAPEARARQADQGRRGGDLRPPRSRSSTWAAAR